MSNFIQDTLMIDEKINVEIAEVKGEMLEAVLLPYYMDPDSLELMVVMKRSILPGAYARTGRKMGISALSIVLPEDEAITVEQAYESLELGATIQTAIPFGSVMPIPETSNLAYELVVIHTEPFEFLDEARGIIKQEKGKYEIGAVKFSDIIKGIENNIIQDLKTRLILNELYIMVVEEANKNQDPNNMMVGNENLIGNGSNLPEGFGEQEDMMVTSDIPDEVLKENSQTGYGAIYSNATSKGDFKTAVNK